MVPGRSVTADTGFFPRMIAKLKSIKFDSSQDLSIVAARKVASQQLAEVVEVIYNLSGIFRSVTPLFSYFVRFVFILRYFFLHPEVIKCEIITQL